MSVPSSHYQRLGSKEVSCCKRLVIEDKAIASIKEPSGSFWTTHELSMEWPFQLNFDDSPKQKLMQLNASWWWPRTYVWNIFRSTILKKWVRSTFALTIESLCWYFSIISLVALSADQAFLTPRPICSGSNFFGISVWEDVLFATFELILRKILPIAMDGFHPRSFPPSGTKLRATEIFPSYLLMKSVTKRAFLAPLLQLQNFGAEIYVLDQAPRWSSSIILNWNDSLVLNANFEVKHSQYTRLNSGIFGATQVGSNYLAK